LRKLTPGDSGGEPSDAALLARFVGHHDEDAFAALLRRHGPMVLGVCHRILGDPHDADDAFQTTFLVLARRADSVGRPERLGNWLYGVAWRTARKARAGVARRRAELRPAPEPAVTDTTEELAWRELRPVLDEELSRLPDKYRTAVVLCDLEGRTHEEVARQLGCPRATVTTRLARARERLRGRLARRGLAPSGAAVAALLSGEAATAALRAGMAETTIRAALGFAAGKTAAAAVSPSAAALAEGVLTTMFWGQVINAAAVLLALGLLGGGAGVVAYRALAGEPARPAKQEAAAKDQPGRASYPAAADRAKLQGTWVAVSGEKDGQPLPDDALRQIWFDINGNEIAFHPSGKDTTRVTFTLDPARKPKVMSMTAQNGPDRGKSVPASYEVEGDRLKFCHDTEKGEKVPKAFAAPQGSGLLSLVLKRVPEVGRDQKRLRGTWQAVSGEGDGKPLADDFIKSYKAVFHGDRVTLSADDKGEGAFTLDPKKTPKWIDITISDKEKALGIYEVKRDTLKLCMIEDKDGNARPTEFTGQGKQILLVFQRVPEEEKQPPASRP
jgi:RNA polymerase sigma factor (sigma-70 family)